MTSHAPSDAEEPPDQLFATMRAGYQALGQLLQQHRNYLITIMAQEMDERLLPRHGASDIVQNAFLHVLENFQRSTEGIFAVGTQEDLRKWLRKVGQNALHKQQRDEGRQKRDFRMDQPIPEGFDQQAGDPSPSSIYRRQERDDRLTQAVNALPEANRMLLRLRVLHDWTYAALAELLDGKESDAGRMVVKRRVTKIQFDLGDDGPIQDLEN